MSENLMELSPEQLQEDRKKIIETRVQQAKEDLERGEADYASATEPGKKMVWEARLKTRQQALEETEKELAEFLGNQDKEEKEAA